MHNLYCGYWYVGRPTLDELRKDLREMMKKVRPDFEGPVEARSESSILELQARSFKPVRILYMISPEEIKANPCKGASRIRLIETQDLTGGGDHWQVIIVSPAFEGKGLLEQHRMVNEALKEADGRPEYPRAGTEDLFSPAQWEKLGS